MKGIKIEIVKFNIATKVYENGAWMGKEVERKYKINWANNYAGVYNEDGFFVDDIELDGLKGKEERMEHVVNILKSWK